MKSTSAKLVQGLFGGLFFAAFGLAALAGPVVGNGPSGAGVIGNSLGAVVAGNGQGTPGTPGPTPTPSPSPTPTPTPAPTGTTSLVQSIGCYTDSGTTVTCTLPAAVTAGDSTLALTSGGATTFSNAGYAAVGAYNNGTSAQAAYFAATGTRSVTLTASSAGDLHIELMEFSFVGTPTGFASSTTPGAPTQVAGANNNVIVDAWSLQYGVAYYGGMPTGWTEFHPDSGNGVYNYLDIGIFQNAIAASSYSLYNAGSNAISFQLPSSVPTPSPIAQITRPVQCVDIYTAAQGNPGCLPLYSSGDVAVNGGPVPDPSSSAWLTKEGANNSNVPGLDNITCPNATQVGGANYAQDSCQSMFYNPNGKASTASFATQITYTVVCNQSLDYSCGHSWTGATLAVSSNARAQNPSSDHHFSSLNEVCQAAGVTGTTNPPVYTIAGGDRCEHDDWFLQPGAPSPGPTSGAGSTITVGGEGQCDEDANLGWYDASGSDASSMCEGLTLNPADLETAVAAGTYVPYALMLAGYCTENDWEFPSVYYDGYETSNGCPPNGARIWSDITDAQVNATSWSAAKKALLRTMHHMGGFLYDTTGGYGNGIAIQMVGSSGFTVDAASDSDSVDPVQWLLDPANGGNGAVSIPNAAGGTENGLLIDLSSLSPYSVASDFHFCASLAPINTNYTTSSTLPKTCTNI